MFIVVASESVSREEYAACSLVTLQLHAIVLELPLGKLFN
jgi:hypothetical protein